MKRYITVVIIGVCIGILLLIIKETLNIDGGIFWKFYIIGGVAVVLGAVLFNVLYTNKYQTKMKKALSLLEEGKTQEYINIVQELLKNAKSKNLKTYFKLNLTAGYCKLKQFDKAIEILEELQNQPLKSSFDIVCRLNLCICYFYTSQNSKAMKLYNSSQKYFEPFKKSDYYGGSLAIIDIFAYIQNGQLEKAKELLKTVRKKWDNPNLYEDYDYVENLLNNTLLTKSIE